MKHLLVILLITSTIFFSANPSLAVQDINQKVTKLENKIAKKFQKTFCNSTGFGISYDGALKFALGETKGEFANNQLIGNVDLENLKDQILADIARTCYYFELTKADLDTLKFEEVN